MVLPPGLVGREVIGQEPSARCDAADAKVVATKPTTNLISKAPNPQVWLSNRIQDEWYSYEVTPYLPGKTNGPLREAVGRQYRRPIESSYYTLQTVETKQPHAAG